MFDSASESEPAENSAKLESIPLGLRSALESGECVLFVGAGIGANVKGRDGQFAPDSKTLANELAQHFSIEASGDYDLAKIAEIVEIRKGRIELETFLKERLSDLEPDENLRWLFSLRWKAVFTTNYDKVIERAYELNPNPPQRPITISTTSELVPFDARLDVPIYHLHGSLFGPPDASIIITQADYVKFRERRRMLFELLKKEFATSTVIYVGYSNTDPNWHTVLAEIRSEFYPSTIPLSFRIAPSTDALDVEILEASGIETISATLDQFTTVASTVLKASVTDLERLKRLGPSVPPDLSDAYERTPASVLRLLASWTYVNQAPFNENPNRDAFLLGDRANWGLIGAHQYFDRDIEEDIYDELLDYATSQSNKPSNLIVLASAGYGVSTLLMSLAVRLVRERAGPVFMQKPGAPLIQGDIEFSASLFPGQRPFFVIDNAADHSSSLPPSYHRMKDIRNPVFFLLGERKNEWRQARGKFNPREFEIEPLSDPEINRLLDYLGGNAALGVLTDLDRDKQFAVVKSKHAKELLVTMREATEGKDFDAILESEYRGIKDNISRRLYLAVCGFYQHGAYARDTLLADLLGCPLTELYSRTKDATEGVVVFDCVDESRGRYAARARHRTIATVVWERCGDLAEKEELLQKSIAHLNVNYGTDKDAFEQFIKSDRMVDSIRTLEGRIRFFEVACQKDPESAYVRQHYARMLSRDGKAELALGQIDQAIKIGPRVRILYHTKGVVLSQLALTTESLELARRRLVQSEQAFRQCLAMHDRDEYAYQGLASLYLDWAKRAPEPEAAEYVAKCEETISAGLRVVPVRDGLWIVSSEVEKWLGNQPSHLRSLERAVNEAPGSIIARYLLGRAYRKEGRLREATDVLDPVINNHPDEFRACIEYAVALVELGEPYVKAIAILRLGALYGFSDPRFVATLGGLLFMNHDFTEAEKVFSEAVRRGFPSSEANTIHWRPSDAQDRSKPMRIEGRVAVVKAGYAIIEATGFPKFLCPGSKFGRLVMKSGTHISFEPAFSAKGAVADKPRTI